MSGFGFALTVEERRSGMTDREKVIYSIERCICHVPDACRDCGYDNHEYNECVEKLLRDALELLKEQEQRINFLEERLRLLEYGDQGTLQSGLMPAT